MTVDHGNRIRIRNADMVRLYTDQRAMLPMRLVDSEVAAATTALVEKPEVAKGC